MIARRIFVTFAVAASLTGAMSTAAVAKSPAVSQLTNPQQPNLIDGRSPDTRDAAVTVPTVSSPLDGRSPDTIDAGYQAHLVGATSGTPDSFAWGDFGIGVAAALGLVLLAAGISLVIRTGTRKSAAARTA
jgi:hypothetical protein